MLRHLIKSVIVLGLASPLSAAPGDTFLTLCISTGTSIPPGVASPDLPKIKEAVTVLKNLLAEESCEKAKTLLAGRTSLDLRSIQFNTLMPLKDLTTLQELYIEGSELTDLTPLADLTNLVKLSLSGSKISNLSGLGTLAKLTDFSIYTQQPINLAILTSPLIKNLTIDTPAQIDLAPLGKFKGLGYLYLDLPTKQAQSNPFAFLAQLRKLEWLFLSVVNFDNQAQFLAGLPLKNLAINAESWSTYTSADAAHFASLNKLEALSINLAETYDLIRTINAPNLKSLVVDTSYTAPDNYLFSDILPPAKLKHLAIAYNADGDPLYLSFTDQNLKNLESLSLFPSPNSYSTVMDGFVFPDLAALPELKSLELEVDPYDASVVPALQKTIDQVRTARKLQRFSLTRRLVWGLDVADSARPKYSVNLSNLPAKTLRHLTINGYDFASVPADVYSGLWYLDFADTSFSDARTLAKLTEAKALRLSRTKLPAVPAFPNLPNVEWIDISGTEIAKADSLLPLPKLEEIHAVESRLTAWSDYLIGKANAFLAPAWLSKVYAKFSSEAQPLDYPTTQGLVNLALAAKTLQSDISARMLTLAKIQGIDNSQETLEISCWQILYHFKEMAQLKRAASESADSSHVWTELTKPICSATDQSCKDNPLKNLYKADLAQCLWVRELINQQSDLLEIFNEGVSAIATITPVPPALVDYYTMLLLATASGSQLQETTAAKARLKDLASMSGSTAAAIARIKAEAAQDLEASIADALVFLAKVERIRSSNIANLQTYRQQLKAKIDEAAKLL